MPRKKKRVFGRNFPNDLNVFGHDLNSNNDANERNCNQSKTEEFIKQGLKTSDYVSALEKCSLGSSDEVNADDVLFQNSSEFPSLAESVNRKKLKITTINKDDRFPEEEDTVSKSFLHLGVSFVDKKKKPKRSDPIRIDFNSALQASLQKSIKKPKRLQPAPKREIVGNPLDSSNPVRRKGKVRLNKKKKLGSLKKLILIERLLKKTTSVNCDETNRNVDNSCVNLIDKDEEKQKIHSRNFAKYCTNSRSKELDECVKEFLHAIRKFQDRAHRESEIKAKAKRRYVLGFHECRKFMLADKIKLFVIPTNIENNNALNATIEGIKKDAEERGIPIIYALKCQSLSRCFIKKNRTCIVGIANYHGADELYEKMICFVNREKLNYSNLLSSVGAKESLPSTNECTTGVEEGLAKDLIDKLRDVNLCNPGTIDEDQEK